MSSVIVKMTGLTSAQLVQRLQGEDSALAEPMATYDEARAGLNTATTSTSQAKFTEAIIKGARGAMQKFVSKSLSPNGLTDTERETLRALTADFKRVSEEGLQAGDRLVVNEVNDTLKELAARDSRDRERRIADLPEFREATPSQTTTQWLEVAQNAADVNRWGDQTLMGMIKNKLRGPASAATADIKPKNYATAELFMKAIQERLEAPAASQEAKMQYKNCTRLPGQSVRVFWTKLWELHSKAFPTKIEDINRDFHLIEHFVEGINSKDAKEALLRQQPQTFSDALRIAELEMGIQQQLGGTPEPWSTMATPATPSWNTQGTTPMAVNWGQQAPQHVPAQYGWGTPAAMTPPVPMDIGAMQCGNCRGPVQWTSQPMQPWYRPRYRPSQFTDRQQWAPPQRRSAFGQSFGGQRQPFRGNPRGARSGGSARTPGPVRGTTRRPVTALQEEVSVLATMESQFKTQLENVAKATSTAVADATARLEGLQLEVTDDHTEDDGYGFEAYSEAAQEDAAEW